MVERAPSTASQISRQSPDNRSVRSFRTNFKRNAPSSIGSGGEQRGGPEVIEEPRLVAVADPSYQFEDDLSETDVHRLRVWKEADNKRKRQLEAENSKKRKGSEGSKLGAKYKTKADEVNESITYSHQGSIIDVKKVRTELLKKLPAKIIKANLQEGTASHLNQLNAGDSMEASVLQSMASQPVSHKRSKDEKQHTSLHEGSTDEFMKGRNLFSEHPRKLLKPNIGVTYKDKSGCEMGGTMYQDNPARKTMTRLQYQSLEQVQKRANPTMQKTAMERFLRDRPQDSKAELADQSGTGGGGMHLRRASLQPMDRRSSSMLMSRSSTRQGGEQQHAETPLQGSRVRLYNAAMYRTNTTKFSTDLTTSLGLTKFNRRNVTSDIGKYWQREQNGAKVVNFKRHGHPQQSNGSAIVQLNMTILNDSKWGQNRPASKTQKTLLKKPPKFLPSLYRDSSIITGVSEVGGRSPLSKTHTRIRTSSGSLYTPLPPPPVGKVTGHGLFEMA